MRWLTGSMNLPLWASIGPSVSNFCPLSFYDLRGSWGGCLIVAFTSTNPLRHRHFLPSWC